MPSETEQPKIESVRKLTAEETDLFVNTFGQDALTFIQQNSELVVDESASHETKKTFLFTYAGRAVEMVVDGPSIGMHFSMIEDYVTKNPDKYKHLQSPERFGTSLKFMKFLNKLMSHVHKDIPLIVSSASKERSELFEEMLKKLGFTKAYFGYIL